MKKLLVIILGLTSSLTFAQNKYFGAQSTEADLSFKASLELKQETEFDLKILQTKVRKRQEITALVNDQLSYLIGHLQSAV